MTLRPYDDVADLHVTGQPEMVDSEIHGALSDLASAVDAAR